LPLLTAAKRTGGRLANTDVTFDNTNKVRSVDSDKQTDKDNEKSRTCHAGAALNKLDNHVVASLFSKCVKKITNMMRRKAVASDSIRVVIC
jgi:hypothetical protein